MKKLSSIIEKGGHFLKLISSWKFGLWLFLITCILLELGSRGSDLLSGIIGFSLGIGGSFLIPIGLILFFLKWPKTKTIKLVTFLLLLPLIFRYFAGTYWGSSIVFPIIDQFYQAHSKRIERKALNTNDPEKCFKIFNSFWQSLYFFPVNVGFNRSPWAFDLECIANYAIVKNNPDVCKLILKQQSNAPAAFANDCFYEVAIKLKNPEICENITPISLEEQKKDECFKAAMLEAKALENPILQECARGASDFAKDICVRNLAVEKKDKDLCKFLIIAEHQSSCELDVKILTEEILAPCRKFVTLRFESEFQGPNELEWNKEDCLREMFIKFNKIEMCNFLPDFDNVLCFEGIIKKGMIDNIEFCYQLPLEKGKTWKTRNACFATVAVNKRDPRMCDIAQEFKERCREVIEKLGER